MKDTQELQFGEQFRRLRKNQYLSLKTVAANAGMTTERLTRIEQSKVSPALEELQHLAAALDAPLIEILLATDQISPRDLLDMADFIFGMYSKLPSLNMLSLKREVQELVDTYQPGERRPRLLADQS